MSETLGFDGALPPKEEAHSGRKKSIRGLYEDKFLSTFNQAIQDISRLETFIDELAQASKFSDTSPVNTDKFESLFVQHIESLLEKNKQLENLSDSLARQNEVLKIELRKSLACKNSLEGIVRKIETASGLQLGEFLSPEALQVLENHVIAQLGKGCKWDLFSKRYLRVGKSLPLTSNILSSLAAPTSAQPQNHVSDESNIIHGVGITAHCHATPAPPNSLEENTSRKRKLQQFQDLEHFPKQARVSRTDIPSIAGGNEHEKATRASGNGNGDVKVNSSEVIPGNFGSVWNFPETLDTRLSYTPANFPNQNVNKNNPIKEISNQLVEVPVRSSSWLDYACSDVGQSNSRMCGQFPASSGESTSEQLVDSKEITLGSPFLFDIHSNEDFPPLGDPEPGLASLVLQEFDISHLGTSEQPSTPLLPIEYHPTLAHESYKHMESSVFQNIIQVSSEEHNQTINPCSFENVSCVS